MALDRSRREVRILPQPTDTTCGPTCLQAVYGYYGDDIPLDQVIREVVPLAERGTLAVLLARHALARGYRATIYTYNLHVFDPTWFGSDREGLAGRLEAQASRKEDAKLRFATSAYLGFLRMGGEIRFEELTPELIVRFLDRGQPLLTGLSATYLYGCARERGGDRLVYDDIGGVPTGHFVVLCQHDADRDQIIVADPLADNPAFPPHFYAVGVQRVLGAILLGVLTYDANFLVVEPPDTIVPVDAPPDSLP
jgi:hypothetical protein